MTKAIKKKKEKSSQSDCTPIRDIKEIKTNNYGNHSPRCTKETHNKRLLDIVQDILSLKNHSTIAHTRSQEWQIKPKTVQKYISKANTIIANRPQESTQELINKHISVREQLYQEATQTRDKLSIVESISKLQGLDVKRIKVINDKKHEDINDSIIIEALSETEDCE